MARPVKGEEERESIIDMNQLIFVRIGLFTNREAARRTHRTAPRTHHKQHNEWIKLHTLSYIREPIRKHSFNLLRIWNVLLVRMWISYAGVNAMDGVSILFVSFVALCWVLGACWNVDWNRIDFKLSQREIHTNNNRYWILLVLILTFERSVQRSHHCVFQFGYFSTIFCGLRHGTTMWMFVYVLFPRPRHSY